MNLNNLIGEGIAVDLFKAERAISVIRSIGKWSNQINDSDPVLSQSFAYYQKVSLAEYVLSVARLYDKRSKRNKTRCMDELIYSLAFHSNKFPSIQEPYQVKEHIKFYQLSNSLIELIDDQKEELFAKVLGNILLSESTQLEEYRMVIKEWRDQIYSHNDPTPKVSTINFKQTEKLLDFGWKTITLIGWCFMNKMYGLHGNYYLKKDAQRMGNNIDKFLSRQFK